jgi:hypothetical protein
MKCLVCGKPIKQQTVLVRGGFAFKGRPKTYCSDHCRDFTKYFNAMQKELDQIELDDEHKRKIRGEMFRVGNSLKFPTIVNFSTKTS